MTVTTLFVECVSCGAYQDLYEGDHPVDDEAACKIAATMGWTVRGHRCAKRTRCPTCRKKGRRDTRAADENRIGKRAGRQTGGRWRG